MSSSLKVQRIHKSNDYLMYKIKKIKIGKVILGQ